MYDHQLDRRIDRIAQKQCGAFSLEQLRAAGGGPNAAGYRIQLGRWIPLAPSVLAVASFAPTFERQCWAGVLGEPDASVGALSAAYLLGFPDFRPGRLELVVPPRSNARNGIARIHRYAGAKVTKRRGLPITTPAQTAFDIASRVGIDRLERAIDDQLLSGRMTLDDLEDRLTAYAESRRAGLPVMRVLVEERRAGGLGPAVSELERLGDRVLRRLAGRPTVVAEASFPWLDRGKGRVDRFLPDEGVIVEFDGRRWHARVKSFDADRWRDNQAAAAGLVVLRFTWAHLTLRPRDVLGIIEQTRRVRRPPPDSAQRLSICTSAG